MKSLSKKKLLDQACRELVRTVRDTIRLKHYSICTERAYVDWIRRFILFHDKRHPQEMGSAEIKAFLTHLASPRSSRRPRPLPPTCCLQHASSSTTRLEGSARAIGITLESMLACLQRDGRL